MNELRVLYPEFCAIFCAQPMEGIINWVSLAWWLTWLEYQCKSSSSLAYRWPPVVAKIINRIMQLSSDTQSSLATRLFRRICVLISLSGRADNGALYLRERTSVLLANDRWAFRRLWMLNQSHQLDSIEFDWIQSSAIETEEKRCDWFARKRMYLSRSLSLVIHLFVTHSCSSEIRIERARH